MKLFAGLLLFLLLGHGEVGAETASPSQAQPIDVVAGELVIDETAGTATFTGDVVATQGEITLHADVLVLNLGDGNRIEHLRASGGVRIMRGDEVATAATADYDLEGKEITLEGDAMIHRGENSLGGERIVIDLQSRRSTVIGKSESRVKAEFRPKREGE